MRENCLIWLRHVQAGPLGAPVRKCGWFYLNQLRGREDQADMDIRNKQKDLKECGICDALALDCIEDGKEMIPSD